MVEIQINGYVEIAMKQYIKGDTMSISKERSLWTYTEKQINSLHKTWEDIDYVMMNVEGKLIKCTLDDFAQFANNPLNSDADTCKDRDGIVIVFKDTTWMKRAIDRNTCKVEWWEVNVNCKYGERKSSIDGEPPGWMEEVKKRDKYFYFLPLAGTGYAGINRIQTDEELGRK